MSCNSLEAIVYTQFVEQYYHYEVCYKSHFTARSRYASAVLGIVIQSVCLSVHPFVTRVLSDEIIEHTADILIPHERVIIPVF